MQVIRRIGLIGDLHAEHTALGFVLAELKGQALDALLQVGDIADGPGDLNASCALLREHRVLCVRGNHDRWLLGSQMREVPYANALETATSATAHFLSGLPVTREFRSPRGNVLLCHGLGRHDMAGVKPDDAGSTLAENSELQALISSRRYRFVLNGHTHRAMLRTFGQLSIVNAGTLYREDERSFTIVDFERGELERFRLTSGADVLDRDAWRSELQLLAESPSEPFREPFA